MFDALRLTAHNPGPMTGSGNNTYLLVPGGARSANGTGALLIDAGIGQPEHLDELGAWLAAHRTQLDAVAVTHAHRDHASGAPAIAGAHPTATFHKFPWPEMDADVAVDWRPVADGDVLRAGDEALVVVHTPGHSPDHVAFWHEPSRTAFTGDLVVQGSSVMIEASRGGDLGQYLRSLERILALDARRLLPAHGPEIAEPAAVLRGYLEHRAMRERQVLAALRAGCDTVERIADCIYDGLLPALMPAARENVRAHLAKLRAEGAASDQGGRWTL